LGNKGNNKLPNSEQTTKDWKIQKKQKTKTKPKTKTKQEQKTSKTKTTWCNIMISERNKHLLAFEQELLTLPDY
jgi:hypothetical protein